MLYLISVELLGILTFKLKVKINFYLLNHNCNTSVKHARMLLLLFQYKKKV